MFTVCRLTTVVALLLHSIFGCGLHHACGCDSHAHVGGEIIFAVGEAPSVHADLATNHDCGHCHHHHGSQSHWSDRDQDSSTDQTQANASADSALIASCLCCEPGPWDSTDPGCHSELGCSFVHTNHDAFTFDAPLVAFVVYRQDSKMNYFSSFATQGQHRWGSVIHHDSLSHCASLCTWQI